MPSPQRHRNAILRLSLGTLPALLTPTVHCFLTLPLLPKSVKNIRVSCEETCRAAEDRGHACGVVRRSPRARTVLFAGGFGAAVKAGTAGAKAEDAPGVDEARTALEESGGDLNRATSFVFHQRLSERARRDQELAEMLSELSATGATRSAAPIENEALHEALVSATWDAVAVMNALPKSRKSGQEEREEKRIAKRLKRVANAARLPPAVDGMAPARQAGESSKQPFEAKILDIGCGDGMLMPFLVDETATTGAGKKHKKSKKGGGKKAIQEYPSVQTEVEGAGSLSSVAAADVTGVDLSEVMISAAKLYYKDAQWLAGNLLSLHDLLGLDSPKPLFSTTVFNGSLQFFRDPVNALKVASEWLVDGGHVVIAHVQGSDFVADECRRNPRVVPSRMPTREGMEAWAAGAGLTLLDGADDESQREFLLHVMRKS